MSEPQTTNEKMYESNNITNLLEMNRAENTAEFNENYKNILKPYMNWMGHDLNYRMDIFLRRRIQKLCRGTVRNLCTYMYFQIYTFIVQYAIVELDSILN